MKTIGLTVRILIEVADDVAELMATAPGFITVDGVTLGEEGLRVGYAGEGEVEPSDMNIAAAILTGNRWATFVDMEA